MGWEPIEGGGQRHVVDQCDDCPCFGYEWRGDARCGVTMDDCEGERPPPSWCPLRSGPVTVELESNTDG